MGSFTSFRALETAIEYEIDKQTDLWEEGTPPTKEQTVGWIDDEKTILARMNSFQKSMIDENNIVAGSLFDNAPYSATKYRQYKEDKA